MNRSEIESLVQKWAAAVASGSTAGLAELIAEDARDVSGPVPVVGRATFLARTAAVQAAFTGIEVRVDQLVVDGENIAWRWTLRGTHSGPLAGRAPTGDQVALRGVNFQRVAAGRVVEHWTLVDVSALSSVALR